MSAGTETNRWATPAAAAAVAQLVALSDEAMAVLKPEHSPKQFAAALVAAVLGADAMRLIAFALPRREALWWAAQCVRAVPALVAEPKCAKAIEAVEKWCAKPADDLRRAALAAAEAAEIATPAGCVAMAVFLSEGSLAPPNIAAVAPLPSLGPGMAGNAVVLAAVIKFPEKASEKHAIFLQLADAVAAGTNSWAPKPAAPANAPPAPAPQTTAKSFPPYPQPKR